MKWTKYLLIVAALGALTACDDRNLDNVRTNQVTRTGRFDMRVVDEFRDSNAYNHSRSIFIITDTKTHKKYIGVEGVGVTDLGDERSKDDDDDSAAAAATVTTMTAVQ